MEKVEAQPGLCEHLKTLQQYLTAQLIIVAKLSILDVWTASGYISKQCNMKKVQQEKTEAYKEFNRRRMQNEKSATSNSATHKKSAARKTVQHEKITTQKSGT